MGCKWHGWIGGGVANQNVSRTDQTANTPPSYIDPQPQLQTNRPLTSINYLPGRLLVNASAFGREVLALFGWLVEYHPPSSLTNRNGCGI